MAPQYRLLFKILCSFIEPSTHTSDVTAEQALLLYGIGRGYSFDMATKIWSDVYTYTRHPPGTSSIPYASIITRFLTDHHVPTLVNEPIISLPSPICFTTLNNSTYPITLPKNFNLPLAPPEPQYPTIAPLFSSIHLPPDFKLPWDSPIGGASSSASLPPPQRDIELLGFLQRELGSLHSKIDSLSASIGGFNRRLDAIEARLGVQSHTYSCVVDAIDRVTKASHSYVERFKEPPIVEVDANVDVEHEKENEEESEEEHESENESDDASMSE